MIMTGKRHDFLVDYAFGFDQTGRLDGVDVEFNGRCGYSADLSLGVIDRTMFHTDNAYFYPAARIYTRRVRTNTVSNTAFRGFGGPQGMVFAERMMDSIAIKLGLDPLVVRKRNLYGPGRDVTPYAMKIRDNIAPQVVRHLEKSSDYRGRRKAVARFNARSTILKKGIALTPAKFGIAFTLKQLNQAGALVHVYTDGSVQVNHGGTEMGQGLYVKVAQVVAEEFGIDVERVKITATTTDKVPNTAPTAASSGSDLNGMAAKKAAETIRKRLAELAARLYQVEKSQVVFAGNRVRAGHRDIAFEELTRSAFVERVSLSSTGYFATPKITWDRGSASGRPFLYFAYGGSLRRSHRGRDHGRDESRPSRYRPRCREVVEPGYRYGSDRRRVRAGNGLADHRRAGLRCRGPAPDSFTIDLQDPDLFRRAGGLSGSVVGFGG